MHVTRTWVFDYKNTESQTADQNIWGADTGDRTVRKLPLHQQQQISKNNNLETSRNWNSTPEMRELGSKRPGSGLCPLPVTLP